MFTKNLLFLVLSLQTLALASASVEDDLSVTRPKINSISATVSDRERLFNDLFNEYNRKVNPDNCTVKFGVALLNLQVREERSYLETYVWLRYVWNDERLTWNPEDYGGLNVIRIPSDEVWKPDITLYNSEDPVKKVNCWKSNVLIYPNGDTLWVPPCKLSSTCHYTLRKDPYGEQTCSLQFGSWTHDAWTLNLDFYQNVTEVDLSDFDNTSNFEVVSTSAKRNVRYYSCCEEPYVDIAFNVTIKRIPGEELFNKM